MRFHFQVRTDTHVLLADASELEDVDEARIKAARRVGTLLHEHAGQLWADEEWRMDITNADGLILFVIQISAMRTAATAEVGAPPSTQ